MSTYPDTQQVEAPEYISRDLDHLRILSIFYYVLSGFTFFFALIPLIYIGLGIAMLNGALDNGGGQPPPKEVGYVLIAIGGVLFCLGMLMGALLVMAGRRLASQRGYVFCMVIAVLLCLNLPLGTILGIFTMVVLMRDSVKALFDARASGAY